MKNLLTVVCFFLVLTDLLNNVLAVSDNLEGQPRPHVLDSGHLFYNRVELLRLKPHTKVQPRPTDADLDIPLEAVRDSTTRRRVRGRHGGVRERCRRRGSTM